MIRNTLICLLVLLPTFLATAIAQDTGQSPGEFHPLKNDTTGIDWVFSLDDAINKARETNRIIILKPVSFRSVLDDDRLSPSSEAQRAISFVDSRVVNLLNHRFVPYYFDLDPVGAVYDEKASQLAKELYPDIRYLSSMPTPPLLFMTPEGKLLGHASNFLSGGDLLNALVSLLEENPGYGTLSTQERVIEDTVQKAQLMYDLRRLEEALELLDKQQGSDAYFLHVQIAREQEKWKAMKAAIRMVTDTTHKKEIEVENILRYWSIRNLEGIKVKGETITKDNPRYQEAMYYLGLAWYHSDNTDKAIKIWQDAIEVNRESSWAYRLDLTQGLVKLDPTKYISEQDKIPSVLGRHYMCPNGLDDLARRDKP